MDSRQESAEEIVTDAADKPENNNNAVADNTTDLFSLLSDEELLAVLSKLNIEDFYNVSLVNRRFGGIIINNVIKQKFTPQEIELIKKCWAELNKLQRPAGWEVLQDPDWLSERISKFRQALDNVMGLGRNPTFENVPKHLRTVILSKFKRFAPKLKADISIDIEKNSYRIRSPQGEMAYNCKLNNCII